MNDDIKKCFLDAIDGAIQSLDNFLEELDYDRLLMEYTDQFRADFFRLFSGIHNWTDEVRQSKYPEIQQWFNAGKREEIATLTESPKMDEIDFSRAEDPQILLNAVYSQAYNCLAALDEMQ